MGPGHEVIHVFGTAGVPFYRDVIADHDIEVEQRVVDLMSGQYQPAFAAINLNNAVRTRTPACPDKLSKRSSPMGSGSWAAAR